MYTPPTGNQPPYNNQPQYGTPGGYVPPGQQQPKSGGCWLWGGLGCLIMFLIFGTVVGISTYKLAHSPSGKSFFGGMSSAMSSASKMGESMTKGKALNSALLRYKEDNGSYPARLSDLVPKYLPDTSALHLDSDTNPDPSHISFDYKQPSASAPGDTSLFSFHNPMDMSMMGMQQKIDQKVTFTIDGNQMIDSTTTMTTTDGKTVTTTSHMDMSTGKTTTSTSGMPVSAPSPISP
jgi:hypothetical protein